MERPRSAAISTTSPWRARSRPSSRVTWTVRSEPSLAPPRTNATAWRSRFLRTASVIVSITSVVRALSCATVASGSSVRPNPYTSRRRKPVMYSAVSRNVLLGTTAFPTAARPAKGSAPRRQPACRSTPPAPRPFHLPARSRLPPCRSDLPPATAPPSARAGRSTVTTGSAELCARLLLGVEAVTPERRPRRAPCGPLEDPVSRSPR